MGEMLKLIRNEMLKVGWLVKKNNIRKIKKEELKLGPVP